MALSQPDDQGASAWGAISDAASSAEDASQSTGAAPVVRRPSQQELYPLHRELQIWMALSKYQLQGLEHRPVWMVNNTSLTLSMGCGLGAYACIRHYRPGWTSLPKQVVPPFAAFYLTFQLAQSIQLPWLYERLLTAPSPLGSQSRAILDAIRTGGRLPSADWERERAIQAAKRAEVAGSPPAETPPLEDAQRIRDGGVIPTAPVEEWGVTPPSDSRSHGLGKARNMDAADEQVPTMGWDASPLPFGDGDSPSETAKARKTPRSWDEIRASSAYS